MLKLSHCLASLTLLTVPAIATSASADTYCYMVTPSGQRIDLGAMCSSPSQTNLSKSQSPRSNPTIPSAISRTTYGSTMVQEGRGGRVGRGTAEDYHYQIWARSNSSGYRLVVWREQNFPDGSPIPIPQTFNSVGEALNHFDCYYTDKSLSACPNNRARPNQNYTPTPRRQTITNTISGPRYR